MITKRLRKRSGISELVAAVLTIAITLIAGAALFGYVNGQAAASENRIGTANAANVNFLNEKFVVTDLAVVTDQHTANIWVYNNGNLTVNIRQIVLYDGTKNSLYVIFNGNTESPSGCGSGSSPKYGGSGSFVFGPTGTQISPQSNPVQITLELPSGCSFSASTTYYANVLGIYGNDLVFPTCDTNSGCTQ